MNSNFSLVTTIKSSKIFYTFYYYIGSFVANILKCFVRADDKLILFVSYGGRNLGDSPKVIYESMLKDSRFDKYKMAWAFLAPQKYDLKKGEKIKINSIGYLIKALKARVWITNVDMRRGLSFDGKHTLRINTWHGTAIKHLGKDCKDGAQEFNTKVKRPIGDVLLAQGQYDVDIFSKAFGMNPENILITGLPRNDELAKKNNFSYIEKLKKEMGLPLDKKIILYAPTFRESKGVHSWAQQQPLNLDKWEKSLSDDYLLIMRGHVIVNKLHGVVESNFVKDYSNYQNLNDLLLVSDILISDYSSIMFDYSILERPIICYAYDYDQYVKDRGVYFDIRNELHSVSDEDSLIETIRKMDYKLEKRHAIEFKNKYIKEYGNASNKVLDLIYQTIS